MLFPHSYLSSATLIDAKFLRARHLQGLLLDIDGTLKDFEAEAVPPHVIAWMNGLAAEGFRLCLYSNGRAPRIGRLAAQLDLPFVAEAMKPSPAGCRRGLALLDLPAERVAVVGDQIFADVLAGRLAGLQTVLVRPTSRVEPWFTRTKRPFEIPIRFLLRSRLDVDVASAATDAAVHDVSATADRCFRLRRFIHSPES